MEWNIWVIGCANVITWLLSMVTVKSVTAEIVDFWSSKIFLESLNYSLVPFGGLIWKLVYVLATNKSAGQKQNSPPKGMKE